MVRATVSTCMGAAMLILGVTVPQRWPNLSDGQLNWLIALGVIFLCVGAVLGAWELLARKHLAPTARASVRNENSGTGVTKLARGGVKNDHSRNAGESYFENPTLTPSANSRLEPLVARS